MRVFISWSGERSRVVAGFLRGWLGDVIQLIEPWMSDQDIDKGAWWTTQMAKELEASAFGVICVTRENAHAPWLLFEAGVLAKSLEKGRVCPYLFEMKPTELTGPLAHFQAANSTSEDTLQLLQSINKALGPNARTEDQVEKAFKIWWPELDRNLRGIPAQSPKLLPPTRSDRDLIEEILTLARRSAKEQPFAPSSAPSFFLAPGLTPFLKGADLDAFSRNTDLRGDPEDPNATDWEAQNHPTDDPLDGYWSSRWNGPEGDETIWKNGHAFIKRMSGFVFILEIEGDRPTPFFICARQDENRLTGRYLNLLSPSDSTPWTGLLVDDDRIDGAWRHGRWDFRRANG